MKVRALELILTANGGAELVDLDAQEQVWASDSDDDFREEFPDFLDENDLEPVFDYLIGEELLTEDEADEAEVSMESLKEGPGDEDDDDDDPPEEVEGEFIPGRMPGVGP
jgi:hypothetical protein